MEIFWIRFRNKMHSNDRNTSIPARRHQQLLELLAIKGKLTVDELAEHFEVSDDTIRRDLQILEQGKMILRTHGGAASTGFLVHRETSFSLRGQAQAVEKSRIARVAAELISDGETLIINGGSTTFAFAASLGLRRNLTIVTNNLAIPAVLPPEAIQEIYVLGGQYQVNLVSTIGLRESTYPSDRSSASPASSQRPLHPQILQRSSWRSSRASE
jgi:DeoR family fructose operon transcriptional repressor